MAAHVVICDGADALSQALLDLGAPFGRGEVGASRFAFKQHFGERSRLTQDRRHGVRAALTDEVVRIEAVRQERE